MTRGATEALVRDYFAAFNAGDREGMASRLHEDVHHHVNQGDVRVGLAKFREFLAHMDRCYRERLGDVVVMASEDGARAAAEFTVHGAYTATDAGLPEARGQTYELPAGSFMTIEGDKITRITTYYNLQDWLRQVGGGS